jgi:hypothetical protein
MRVGHGGEACLECVDDEVQIIALVRRLHVAAYCGGVGEVEQVLNSVGCRGRCWGMGPQPDSQRGGQLGQILTQARGRPMVRRPPPLLNSSRAARLYNSCSEFVADNGP